MVAPTTEVIMTVQGPAGGIDGEPFNGCTRTGLIAAGSMHAHLMVAPTTDCTVQGPAGVISGEPL